MKLVQDIIKMQSLNMMSGVVDVTLLSVLSLIGREKHWFQSQFQADRVFCQFCKFCQAGDIFSSEFFTCLLDQ